MSGKTAKITEPEPIIDDEKPEWTEEDFARAVSFDPPIKFSDLTPEILEQVRIKSRGLQKKPTKIAVSIRLSRDVLDHFKATGPGWQSRIDEALRKAAKVKAS